MHPKIEEALIQIRKAVEGKIDVLTLDEYISRFPEEKEDWELGDYLIVMDNENHMVLSGAYVVEISAKTDDVYMYWLPYPEEPTYGLQNIISHLKNQLI